MREILFKGKRTETGEWVFGCLINEIYGGSPVIVNTPYLDDNGELEFDYYPVYTETVCQYTGLKDKNGKKIFEGDIVKAQDNILGSPFDNGITGKVVYEETAFFIEPQNPCESEYLFNECAVYEIIGNIHDNPELLAGGDCNG